MTQTLPRRPPAIVRRAFSALLSLWIVLFATPSAHAQQPFVTDDADVTDRGKFHFEFSNAFDLLQREAFPGLKQNTASFELAYGLLPHVEISLEAPLITIFNARETGTPRTVSGLGDANFSVKYNFLREREGSRRPALTLSGAVEIPTGSARRGLGSGVADFSLNGVLQKSVTRRTKYRLNGGVIFSGNTLNGAVGLKTRGTVYTGGTSVVREFTPRLQLGAELNGARARNAGLGKGQLQAQLGGNYTLRENLTLDFGLVAGRHSASPRLGAQLGLSLDF
ncbi:MAG TPA: transporter [Pyrinomonadaceae bacterium]|nr:transporter [Pyrinomonadaceae bacterium]